jgi:hypothetical protein
MTKTETTTKRKKKESEPHIPLPLFLPDYTGTFFSVFEDFLMIGSMHSKL